MLLERADGLSEKIRIYKKLKAAAAEASLFGARAEQIADTATQVRKARTSLDQFSKARIQPQFYAKDAYQLCDRAKTLRDIVANDPTALKNPPFHIKHDFTDRLKGIVDAASKAIEDAWRQFTDEKAPGGSDDVLEALGKLPEMRAGVIRIQGCRQRIAALGAAVPSNPTNAVEQLEKLLDEHSAAWAELTADGIPESVLLFLQTCASSGAQIKDLSAEVLKWLETRQLLGSFRIRIG